MTALRSAVLLTDGIAQLSVRPELGGAITSYDLVAGGARRSVLRPAPDSVADPLQCACIPLVPWSNRISGGGFQTESGFAVLAPNVVGEPFPVHGNGFQLPWRISEQRADAVAMALDSDGPGPFRYAASLRYRLAGGALSMRLAVTNLAAGRLAYGLGFHPWFPREPSTTLRAPAAAVWLEDQRHLPTILVPVGKHAAWDFARPRKLPPGWINNSFVGWTGAARIAWPDRKLTLTIDAAAAGDVTSGLSAYILYAPDRDRGFFCFEPVSHPADAHNFPGPPGEHGLFVLDRGGSVSVGCRLTPNPD